MTTVTEDTFANTLIHLLKASVPEPVYDNDFVGSGSHEVVALPAMPQAKKKTNASATSDSIVTVSLKSIRAPKFAVTYEAKSSDSVLGLKERLTGDADGPLAGLGYAPENCRFLVKGRVISDVKSLDELVSDGSVEFSVMLSAPSGVTSKTPEATPDHTHKHKLPDHIWTKIKHLVEGELGPDASIDIMGRFQTSLM